MEKRHCNYDIKKAGFDSIVVDIGLKNNLHLLIWMQKVRDKKIGLSR